MAFKFIVLFAAISYASAGLIGAPVAAPIAYSPAAAVSHSFYSQSSAPVAVAHAAAPVVAAAPVAVAQAAPVAVHAPHYGATSQSVLRSLGGNQAVSHYSKAIDSAFSTVRKYDTRITNDALSFAPAAVAAPAYAVTKTFAAPVAAAPYSVPVAAAPYGSHVAAAPYGSHVAAAPVAVAYSPASVVSHASFEGLGAHYSW